MTDPTADRADLRDRIAEALALRENPPASDGRGWFRDEQHRQSFLEDADAILAVLPPPVSRAAVLREAADALPEADLPFVPPMDRRRVADWLRRMAAETQPGTEVARGSDTASDTAQHSCRNCEGMDPDTCLMNPNRSKRPPMDPVHILGIEAEDDDTAARVRQDGAQTSEPPIVAYSSPGGTALYCTRHADDLGASWTPLVSGDLPDGGLCAKCGVDVLIPQEADRG